MSSAEEPVRLAVTDDDLPTFQLDYGVDDHREPTEITVYDPLAEDVTTHQLTVDAASAVDVTEIT